MNILDLVAVGNEFGTEAPDVNGDGVVNVLDVVNVYMRLGDTNLAKLIKSCS